MNPIEGVHDYARMLRARAAEDNALDRVTRQLRLLTWMVATLLALALALLLQVERAAGQL